MLAARRFRPKARVLLARMVRLRSAATGASRAPATGGSAHPSHVSIRLVVVALAVVALLLAAVTRLTAPASSDAQRLVGKPAPAFALTAEQSGHALAAPVTLEQQRGHPVVLVFTYSLCAHCLSETAAVRDLHLEDGTRGVRVLYIDSPAESPSIAAAYAQRLGLRAPVLLDRGGALASQLGIHYYPAVVLLDAGGVVRHVWTGETSPTALRGDITQALQGSFAG